jgi:hypothetical protein
MVTYGSEDLVAADYEEVKNEVPAIDYLRSSRIFTKEESEAYAAEVLATLGEEYNE